MQGDAFGGVEIPGLDDGPGLAMVLTHACSMRQGPQLRPRLLLGRVKLHAHYFTRYAVETAVLHEQSANVLAEAELLESWIDAAVPDDAEDWDRHVEAENVEFDAFLRAHRDDLKEASRRAAVRRLVNEEIRERFR